MIKGRLVDTNKGDIACPDDRARFVAKESNVGSDPTLYAATPPLEALKLLIAHASGQKGKGVHIMLSDVKRAYFNARRSASSTWNFQVRMPVTKKATSADWP